MKEEMVIYTIRIPKSLREKMMVVNVKWSKEIRKFIENRVKFEMYKLALKRIEELNSKFIGRKPVKPSWMLIREDRER